MSATLSQIKAGKLRPLALFGDKRSTALPDVPTMKELGYDVEYYLWVGMFAPKGTPDSVITESARGARTRRRTPISSRPRSTNLGQELGYHGPAGVREILG